MFSRKFVLTNCLAIATSMLAGCASYKNESGLPKWLDDASEANRLGYFMGLSLKDSPAPEGFDPSKNTLMSDLTISTLAHSNALPGTDIGSFSLELGLSLATNLLKHEEEEYSQATMWFPAASFDSETAAYETAMAHLSQSVKASAEKTGYKVYKSTAFTVFGRHYKSLWVENDKVNCHQSERDSERCFLYVSFDDDAMVDKPYEPASYLGLTFSPAWKIPRLRVTQKSPKTAKLEQDMPTVLSDLAQNLPDNTWLYVAPMKIDGHWTAPYVSDGKSAHFFIKPKKAN